MKFEYKSECYLPESAQSTNLSSVYVAMTTMIQSSVGSLMHCSVNLTSYMLTELVGEEPYCTLFALSCSPS